LNSESIGLLVKRIGRAWRRRTPREFIGLVAYNLRLWLSGSLKNKDEIYDLSFDRTYGTDTLGREEAQYLSQDTALRSHARGYEPVSTARLRALIEHLPTIPFKDYCFIDYGSGKGRGLFLAAAYPFRKIIGVEYSEELHQAAERNIGIYRSPDQKCFDIQSICADASTFEPPREPTLCFMYNPFDEHLMERTARKIESSLAQAPRDFYVMYLNAEHPKPFDQSQSWRSLEHGAIQGMPFAIWQWRGNE
jgi:SAM-dependent methyltransferase